MQEVILTREELYRQVWEQPLSSLAHKYMHTEASFRLVCIEMSVPVPREGYWEKIRSGKQVDIPVLSNNYQGSAFIRLTTREPNKKIKKEPEKKEPVLTALPNTDKAPEVMAATITNLPTDKLIISAGKALRKKDNASFSYSGMVNCPSGDLSIIVSPEMIDRALIFMDSLMKALRVRGHDLVVKSNDTCAVVFQQELKIICRERTKKVTFFDKWERTEFHPCGLLLLKLDTLYGREWVDGKTQTVDDQIPTIIDKLEAEAQREIEWKAEAERSRLEREEQAKLEKQRKERHSKELAASRILLQQALRWEKSNALRSYINELELKASKDATLPEDLRQFIEWARKKADWYDPFINAKDEWLSDTDKEVIEQPAEKKTPSSGFTGFQSSEDDSYPPTRYSWFNKS